MRLKSSSRQLGVPRPSHLVVWILEAVVYGCELIGHFPKHAPAMEMHQRSRHRASECTYQIIDRLEQEPEH